MNKAWITAFALVTTLALLSGCSRGFYGGAAVGATGAGAAYEYQNKKAMDQLDQDYREGRLTKDEYLRRKSDIEKKSILY